MASCKNCKSEFAITSEDERFYERMKVPAPTLCPGCRMQTLMCYRNERSFYKRECEKCGKKVFSVYSPKGGIKVFCADCWWGDGWNAMDYGRDYDFSRPFFDQFKELYADVPQLMIVNALGENVDYSNYCYRCKDCYLLIASDDDEDCHYCNYLWDSRDCIDCLNVTKSELCYELIDSKKCYSCMFSKNLENCSDCHFCFDLKGCKNCFGSVGLRQKSYCFFNEQLGKEEYEEKVKGIKMTHEKIAELKKQAREQELKIPHKYANIINCEECAGDGLQDSKNAKHCYDSWGLEDCKFMINSPKDVKDCYDFCGAKELELSYQGISTGGPGINCRFSCHSWTGCDSVTYCAFCVESQNLWGCVGLHHKKNCILNKQYSEEDYKEMVKKIEKHMMETGEFGDYFPITHCHFAYNETLAQEYYPLTKEEALAKGYRWLDPDPKEYQEPHDDILACSQCGKNFKTIPAEENFYEKHGLPAPLLCPDCRHYKRMAQRPPRKLFDRQCQKCNAPIKTTYSENSPETVYCEKCYLESLG